MAGCRAEASQILDRLTSTHRYVPNWFLSLIWIGMGERERALECLQQAFRDREPCMVSLNVDPMFDPLRPDARFSELVHHVESGAIAGMNGCPCAIQRKIRYRTRARPLQQRRLAPP